MAIESITQIPGIFAAHATNEEAGTGCTVIVCPAGATGAVDVRGGAPATRETDLLRPEETVGVLHAVVLSGGSAYGLAASCGVAEELERRGIGLDVGVGVVPIVSAAGVFDLAVGDSHVRPTAQDGAAATAALPVLGVPLATVSSLLAIASGATADVFPLALLLALAALLWWVSIGRRQRLGAFALLAPLVLGSPEAAVPAAGGTLPPASALRTAVAAWLLERGSELVGTWGLDAQGLLAGVVAAAGDPGSWASLAGVAAASWVCSLLVARGTRASCIAGYALSALVLASFQFAWAQMENITNPGAGDLPSFGVAVVLGVIMCVTTVLHGPGGDAEGDERA